MQNILIIRYMYFYSKINIITILEIFLSVENDKHSLTKNTEIYVENHKKTVSHDKTITYTFYISEEWARLSY